MGPSTFFTFPLWCPFPEPSARRYTSWSEKLQGTPSSEGAEMLSKERGKNILRHERGLSWEGNREVKHKGKVEKG